MKKILILTGSNPYVNAGILSYDIFKSLTENGNDVKLITKYFDYRFERNMSSFYNEFQTRIIKARDKILNKLRIPQKNDTNYYMFGLSERKNYLSTSKLLNKINFSPDVIIYLFPHRFLNAKNLYELNTLTNAPVCIMPVDLAQLSGGCHYTNGCTGFQKFCGSCPGIYSNKHKDITYKNLKFKQKYLSQTKLFVCANTWTNQFVKKSTLYKNSPVFNINVVINEKQFLPAVSESFRSKWDIPTSKFVIFFGATSVKEERKGFNYLLDSLDLLFNELSSDERENIVLVIAGNIDEGIKAQLKFESLILGHLNHDNLRDAYRLADIFVSPSIQDAGPMMVIQSLMCGTPVVCFKMGNSIDFILNGITGYQADLKDVKDMKEGMLKFIRLTHFERNKCSDACRHIALEKSSYSSFNESFLNALDDYLKQK